MVIITRNGHAPAEGTLERPVPYNLEAEEAVLGSLLIDRDAVIKIAPFLKPTDFYRETNGWVYEAILDLYAKREPADIVLLADELERRGRLELCGGYAYLFHLANATPTAVHVEYYAERVERDSIRRRAITAGGQIAALAYEDGEDLEAALDKMEQLLFAVTQRRRAPEETLAGVAGAYLQDLAARLAGPATLRGVPTGFPGLDDLTGGWRGGQLIIEGAPPGWGKSTLGLRHALVAARDGFPVGWVSLEMSSEQLTERALAYEALVDSVLLHASQVSSEEYDALSDASGRFAESAPVHLHAQPVGLRELRALARRWVAEHGIRLLLVDYLQILKVEARRQRTEDVSDLAYGLFYLAQELDVPVIAASQLSREALKTTNPYDWLFNLRESGAIEAAATHVLFPYFPDTQPNSHGWYEGRIVVAKHRNGPTGEVPALWDKHTYRIVPATSRTR